MGSVCTCSQAFGLWMFVRLLEPLRVCFTLTNSSISISCLRLIALYKFIIFYVFLRLNWCISLIVFVGDTTGDVFRYTVPGVIQLLLRGSSDGGELGVTRIFTISQPLPRDWLLISVEEGNGKNWIGSHPGEREKERLAKWERNSGKEEEIFPVLHVLWICDYREGFQTLMQYSFY